MPSWKKVITSGSSPHFTTITSSAGMAIPDDGSIILGNGKDMKLYHTSAGGDSSIDVYLGDFYIRNTATDGDIRFMTDDGTSGHEDYIILDGGDTSIKLEQNVTASGNISASGTGSFAMVGIGTTSPSHLLEIDGGTENAFIQLTTPNTKYGGIAFGDPGSATAGRIQYYHGDNSFQFDTDGKFTFEGGNVGIGTTAPPEVLTVEGNISASGDIYLKDGKKIGSSAGITDNDDYIKFDDTNRRIDISVDNATQLVANSTGVAVGADISPATNMELTVGGDISASGTIYAAAGTVGGSSIITVGDILDEDDMASGSAVNVASQQSIKAYVDAYKTENFIIACSDETTALTTGTAKATFRMPYAFRITDVRASVTTAPTYAEEESPLLQVDINEAGSTILSTKLTIDGTEKTSTTAATAAVVSDSALNDDSEITIDIDAVGDEIAGAGLKVTIIGYQL